MKVKLGRKGCMGYNPKTTYCNLAELEKGGGGVANNSAIFGSSNFEEVRAKRESFVDLKLGRLGDFGTGLSKSALMDPFSSSAGSSKRPRTPSIGGHIVSCSVDGCKADLSKCRDYHRRHKVCEMHSKTSKVTIGGHEQRFCQQCSRFHSLGEFDEGKRSCRKRLEGHNRRRRKPQPEPRPMNAGNFFSVSEGSRFLPFSSQPVIPATSMVNTYWSSAVKSETNPAIYTNSETSSYSNPYKGRQFPFLQPPEPDHTLHHDGSSTSNNNNNQKMFCNEINQLIDSDRALSLLSSSPSETPDMGLNRIIHSNPSTTVNRPPLLPSLHLDGFAPYAGGSQHTPGFQGRPENSALLPDLRNNNNNNSLCQDVFQNRSDGSSTSGGGYQTLSFNWE